MPTPRPIDRWLIDEVLPHEARYLAAARRLTRNPEEAADLVQDALVKLMAVDGWAAIANPRAYATRLIHNLAIERMRRARIVEFQQLAEIDTIDLCDDAPDAFRVAAGRDQVERLANALNALPDRCRTVFVRRRVHEQAPRDIARDLSISVSTLEKRLARALYLLTRALEPGDAAPEEPDHEQDDHGRARA